MNLLEFVEILLHDRLYPWTPDLECLINIAQNKDSLTYYHPEQFLRLELEGNRDQVFRSWYRTIAKAKEFQRLANEEYMAGNIELAIDYILKYPLAGEKTTYVMTS